MCEWAISFGQKKKKSQILYWILTFVHPLNFQIFHQSYSQVWIDWRKKKTFWGFEQAICKTPLILFWIDSYWPRLALLTDRCGRDHHRQRHGGVFVRVCGTGRCGECVIEVPQLMIIPPFWGRSARRRGAAGAGNVSIHWYNSGAAWTVSVCGWFAINIAIVASSVLAFPLVEGGMESDRWEQWLKKMPLSNYMCSVLTGSIQMMMTLQLVRCQGKIRLCRDLKWNQGQLLSLHVWLVGGKEPIATDLAEEQQAYSCKWLSASVDFFKIRDDEMRFIEM